MIVFQTIKNQTLQISKPKIKEEKKIMKRTKRKKPTYHQKSVKTLDCFRIVLRFKPVLR